MSRWEFMRQLEMLLSDNTSSERAEALQYYNDYFNDAGRENEQQVIKALGSPAQVARIVKEGLNDSPGMGEFTENGFTREASSNQNAIVKRMPQTKETGEKAQGYTSNTGMGSGPSGTGGDTQGAGTKKEKEEFPVWAIVLIILGCIICSPVILGVGGAALGVVVSVFATVFALIFGFGLASFILLIVAVALIGSGFGCVFSAPVTAVGLVGGGLICLAIGILFLMLTVFLVAKVIPAVCQGIAHLCKKIFGKKEAKA